MASITTQINLIDRMTSPLTNIMSAVNNVVASMQQLDNAIDTGFDTSRIYQARQAIDQAGVQMQEVQDAIQRSTEEQERFRQKTQQTTDTMGGLTNQVMGLVGAYMGFQGLKNVAALSDNMSRINAKIGMINDGTQNNAELQAKIFASAQRARSAYQDTATVVTQLAQRARDAFTSNEETILFAENLNKSFKVAGASQAEMASASLQLTQALGSGVLRGEELNAVFEAAPNVIQTIADYMGVPIGQVRNLAAEGRITADIVKNAMLGATEDINAQFAQMPITWEEVWTMSMNKLQMAAQPVLAVVGWLAENWAILEPIVIAAAAAVGLYAGALLIYNGISAVSATASAVHAAYLMLEQGATFAATAAQYGFNAALFACPLTWIIALIIGVIAVLYAVVAAINKVTGSSISATGVICGVLNTGAAFVGNLFVGLINFVVDIIGVLWNFVAAFANFFANVFDDPVNAVIRLFYSMADVVLGILQGLASAIDAVFGSSLADAVSGWRGSLSADVEATYGKGKEVMEHFDPSEYYVDRYNYGNAYKIGYDFGAGIGEEVSGWFNAGMGADVLGVTGGVPSDVVDIAGNTAKMSDSMDITAEELKYLREIAEQETVNRFTTAEVKVEMTNHNNINSDMDIDGVVDKFANGVNEAMEKAAEGVHQ